jgi:phosphoglycolate phosphatase-like HAD superfamily hydrolase
MGIIFDLDQTLVDSNVAKTYRDKGQWGKVYDLIPSFIVYDGIISLIEELLSLNIPVCIVTSSPSSYCSKILNHHSIEIVNRVCFHDAKPKKPHPAPILKGIEHLGVDKNKIISIGDDPNDIIASKAAGVFSVAATWGSLQKDALLLQEPNAICNSVEELRQLILSRLS